MSVGKQRLAGKYTVLCEFKVSAQDFTHIMDDIEDVVLGGEYEERICTIDKLVEDLMKPTPLKVGALIQVNMMHFATPQNFYVRLMKYHEVMTMLQARMEILDPSEIKFRSSVVYLSHKNDMYVRGEVLSMDLMTDEPLCSLNAIDYGFIEENVSGRHLWSPLHVTEVPPLAIKCRLESNQPSHPLPPAYEGNLMAMTDHYLTPYGAILIKNTSTDALTVSYYNYSGEDMSSALAQYGHALFGHGIPSTPMTYKSKMLEDNAFMDVVMLYGDYRRFYVAPMPLFTWWLNLQEEFDKYANLQDSLNPAHAREGLPVGAYNKEFKRYERAIINEVTMPGVMVRVFFVDRGKPQHTELTFIKPMVESFMQMPQMAIPCTFTKMASFKEVPLLEYGAEYSMRVGRAATCEEELNEVDLSTPLV